MTLVKRLTGFLTGRLFLTILFLLISAFIAFGLMPLLYRDQSAVLTMPRIKEPLRAGERIEEQHIEMINIGAYNLPVNALVYQEDIVNKFARAAMVPGELLFPEKLSEHRLDSVLDSLQDAGQRLITVTPRSSAAALSSHLQAGDIIGIATLNEARSATGSVTEIIYPEELDRLKVYAVEGSHGNELKGEADEVALSSSSVAQQGDLIPKTVTLIVSDEQAQMLLQAEYSGGIHIIFKERTP